MKFKKILCIVLSALLVFSVAGCSVIEITEKNRVVKTFDPNDPQSKELMKTWEPLIFKSGQSFNYIFEIKTDKYKVKGKFDLSIRNVFFGITQRFDWKFTLGSAEVHEGSYKGDSNGFVEALKEYCSKNTFNSIVYEALFSTYKDAYMYNTTIASNYNFSIGQKWTLEQHGKKYNNIVDSVQTYGFIDGYVIASYLEDENTHTLCISPFSPLPSMTIFYLGEGENYIVCELTGAIL